MCGITGFIDYSQTSDKAMLLDMKKELHHRGPDDSGEYFHRESDFCLGFAHTRLAIIDITKRGRQPMTNEVGSLIITFNGEIYNYQEIREILQKNGHTFRSHTDTEILIHGYEQWGVDVLEKCRGMFAFALYDKKNKKVFLARDRTGVKPLYYYWHGDLFLFGSELKSLVRHNNCKKNVNTELYL